MSQTSVIDFRTCSLSSGLLTQEQLDQAEAMVREAIGTVDNAADATITSADGSGEAIEITDQQLAQQMVALGWLTSFQANKLLAGTATFQLGPYRIVDSLGKGGMGHVFKAEHALMGRTVAVKVLPLQKSTPEAVERFLREIRVHAQLDHPHLVRALDAGHSGNVYYLVTEYIPGSDLRRVVRQAGKLSMEATAWIVQQVARGLAHAHSRGIIHRDVKPGNVLVTNFGVAKLSDLGLVGFLDAESRAGDSLSSNRIVGTADYLSPEQIKTPTAIGPQSDLYSLGCTMYYAVTGKVPFPGGSMRDKCNRHMTVAPLDPRRLNPDLDFQFVDLMADLMEKEPLKRIQSATELIERLEHWTKGGWPGLDQGPTNAGEPAQLKLPVVEPMEAQLSDTESNLLPDPLFEPHHSGSPDASQGTVPIAGSLEETLRDPVHMPIEGVTGVSFWRRLTILQYLILLLAPAGLIVAVMVLWTIFSTLARQ